MTLENDISDAVDTIDNIDVSVIIPALNEADNIGRCLEAIENQDTDLKIEIIVIDSGSIDGTVEIVKSQKHAKLVQIPPEQFGHGRTRNQGASKARGQILVFLNADAIPADNKWLRHLVEPLDRSPKTAGVFGKHLPKPGCHLYMERDLARSMPEKPGTRTKASPLDLMVFSTVSCAIPSQIWQEHPFADDIVIAEDQEWARRVLKCGFSILYRPQSTVFHSHNYTPKEMFQVKFKVGLATTTFKNRLSATVLGFFLIMGGIVGKLTGDFFYIFFKSKIPFSRKLKETSIAIRGRISGFYGRYRGWLASGG